MALTNLSERNKASNLLIAIVSIIFCLSTHSSNAKGKRIKNLFTILQNRRDYCKKIRGYDLKNLDHQGLYALQQAAIEGGGAICSLKNQNELSHESWHKASLIAYWQQPDTQINSDAPATATKKTNLTDQNNLLDDQPVATDGLLEELLGVHTLTTHTEQAKSIWTKISFDCTLGVGAVFYTNRLEQMELLQRQNSTYFLRTKTDEIYKPNWFHHTLDKVTDFNPFDSTEYSKKTEFQGKGLGLPVTLGVQYLCGQRLFIGLGREMIFNVTNRLTHYHNQIPGKTYHTHKRWSAQGRWFAKCGWYAFGNEKHRFFGDMRLFYVHHLGSKLARLVTFGPYLHQTVAYNFGVGYEQQMTDYLSYTMRFAMEWQRFKQFTDKNYNIQYTQPAIYLQVGLSMRCTKCNLDNHLKNRACDTKTHLLNDPSKLEGLQDLLDLD